MRLLRFTLVLLALTVAPSSAQRAAVGPVTLSATSSGTCASTSCASITLGLHTGVGVQVTGTCGTCTLNFESSVDGTNWVAQTLYPSNSNTGASSTSAVGVWYGQLVAQAFRVRMSARSSGSFLVTIRTAPQLRVGSSD